MATPARLSISKAAKLAGKSRQTLYEDRDNGKLSVHRDSRNKPYIDVAELERVYGKLDTKTVSGKVSKRQMETPQKDTKDSALQAEIDALREQLSRADGTLTRERQQFTQQIDDLRTDRDEWREQAKAATRILEDHREKESRGFWSRLFGR